MSWRQLVGAGTWLGAAAAAAVLLAGLAIGSLLLARGVLPEASMRPLVASVSALACFCGGRTAVRMGSGGALPRAMAVAACVYATMWLAGLTGETEPQFDAGGLWQTCAVWGGGLLAGLTGTRRRKRKVSHGHRRSENRRKRSVT